MRGSMLQPDHFSQLYHEKGDYNFRRYVGGAKERLENWVCATVAFIIFVTEAVVSNVW